MRAVDIIIKKRDKHELTLEEIEFFVRGFTNGDIPDYQTSAFAMAILLNGMTPRETTDLTLAMAHSGSMLDLSDVVDCRCCQLSLPAGCQWERCLVEDSALAAAHSISWNRFPATAWTCPRKSSSCS